MLCSGTLNMLKKCIDKLLFLMNNFPLRILLKYYKFFNSYSTRTNILYSLYITYNIICIFRCPDEYCVCCKNNKLKKKCKQGIYFARNNNVEKFIKVFLR